jgi:hypothetical protein
MAKDSRLAYFKDNYQDPTDDEFDPTQYYYKRPERNGGDMEFESLVNGMGAYDTTLGMTTNPTYQQNRFSAMQHMSGLGQTGLGASMAMNVPMFAQQTQLQQQNQLNNNMATLSRVMMQQPQTTSNTTTQRMRMTSPIRNATPNTSIMMNPNGPMHPMEQYRTSENLMNMINSASDQGIGAYTPSQQMQFPRTDVRTQHLLLQQQLQLEQQRLLSQQQQPTTTMASDSKYGLLGLRNVIKMTDQDLNVLALGFDLTTLGLNLNSPEYLYSSFASPWNDRPSHIVPEYKIPSCYLRQPLPLKEWQIKKFSEDTLFYIFYSMPRDVLQIHAARELTNRNWLYHKEQKIWFQQLPNTEVHRTTTYEKGTYKYFDPNTWKYMTKENFIVEYDKVMQMTENQTPSARSGPTKGVIGSGVVGTLPQQQ